MFGACAVVAVKAFAEGHGEFVHINLSDFDPAIHEPYGEADAELVRNAPAKDVGSLQVHVDSSVIDQFRNEVSIKVAELQAKETDLNAEADRQREQADILQAERERLAKLSADLDAKAAALGDHSDKELTATQIKEQLTARGIEFKGNASKADLQALLDGAKPAE